MSNYPDDIHMYDWHPHSPFYEAPLCRDCGNELEGDEEEICEMCDPEWVDEDE